MFSSQRIVPFVFLLALLLVACRPGAVEPGIAPEIFITPGPTGTILLSNEEIMQDNCNGGAMMSQTVERSYTVSRIVELGAAITVDAGGRAGIPGVGEVGVGAAVASHYNVSYGSEETVTRSVTVATEKGQHILHTVRQNMLWETGTLVVAGATDPIPYRFRKDFSMEELPPANLGCPGQAVAPVDPGAATQPGTDSSTAPPAAPEPDSASVPPTSAASPAQESSQSFSSGITAGQLDGLFGSGNWFCFPDRTNGIGVVSLPVNFTVVAPLRYIDTFRGRVAVGGTEPGATGATVELTSALPAGQCPDWQQGALSSWASARGSGQQITSRSQMDGLFGAGNWACLPDYPFGAKVYFYNSDLRIEYPFTTVDISDGTKHGVGDVVNPNGEMTVWFAGSIPRADCP